MVPLSPPRPELVGVTRRQFFNRSIVAMTGLGLSGFSTAVLARTDSASTCATVWSSSTRVS